MVQSNFCRQWGSYLINSEKVYTSGLLQIGRRHYPILEEGHRMQWHKEISEFENMGRSASLILQTYFLRRG